MKRGSYIGTTFLIGYRGCGKTTVGALLAEKLALPFHDLDVLIEEKAGKNVRAIFAEGGEDLFRDLESEMLQEVRKLPKAIVATGGGVVLRQKNRDLLREMGPRIWLRASVETLWQRIQADPTTQDRRPALSKTAQGKAEIEELFIQREPIYRQLASVIIDTEMEPGKIVEAILRELGSLESRDDD